MGLVLSTLIIILSSRPGTRSSAGGGANIHTSLHSKVSSTRLHKAHVNMSSGYRNVTTTHTHTHTHTHRGWLPGKPEPHTNCK